MPPFGHYLRVVLQFTETPIHTQFDTAMVFRTCLQHVLVVELVCSTISILATAHTNREIQQSILRVFWRFSALFTTSRGMHLQEAAAKSTTDSGTERVTQLNNPVSRITADVIGSVAFSWEEFRWMTPEDAPFGLVPLTRGSTVAYMPRQESGQAETNAVCSILFGCTST